VRTHHPFDAENHNRAFSTTATSKSIIINWKQKHTVAEQTSSAFAVSSKSPASNYSAPALSQQRRNEQSHIGIRNIPSQKRLPRFDDLCKWIDSNLLYHGINRIRIALGLHRRLFFSDVFLWFLFVILHFAWPSVDVFEMPTSQCSRTNYEQSRTTNPVLRSSPDQADEYLR
jgi:hypothetical protein